MKYLLILLIFFLSGCSIKNYQLTQTKIIIIKSPKLKFADIGYLRSTDKAIELELFIAGNPVEKITINTLICVREGCMTKSGFNEDYLHKAYPDELLQNILLGNEIYDGEAKVRTLDGFEQRIIHENVDIKYKVNSKTVFFKDRKNKIIFKIKDIK